MVSRCARGLRALGPAARNHEPMRKNDVGVAMCSAVSTPVDRQRGRAARAALWLAPAAPPIRTAAADVARRRRRRSMSGGDWQACQCKTGEHVSTGLLTGSLAIRGRARAAVDPTTPLRRLLMPPVVLDHARFFRTRCAARFTAEGLTVEGLVRAVDQRRWTRRAVVENRSEYGKT